MKILSNARYNSLLRAAGKNLEGMAISEYANGLNETAMLLWRLSGVKKLHGDHPIMHKPFEYLEVVNVTTKMLIFVVHQGEGLILEDGAALFPSDELVAKLRLMVK